MSADGEKRVEVQCSNKDCRKVYRVPASKLGSTAVCKNCDTRFVLAPADISSLSIDSSGDRVAGTSRQSSPRKKLGRFEIREELGSGGLGTVYRAHDPKLNRDVALKVPHSESLPSDTQKARFLQEAQAAAKLQHPNIVAVHDSGEDGGRYYIVRRWRTKPASGVTCLKALAFSRRYG